MVRHRYTKPTIYHTIFDPVRLWYDYTVLGVSVISSTMVINVKTCASRADSTNKFESAVAAGNSVSPVGGSCVFLCYLI